MRFCASHFALAKSKHYALLCFDKIDCQSICDLYSFPLKFAHIHHIAKFRLAVSEIFISGVDFICRDDFRLGINPVRRAQNWRVNM